MGYLPQGAHLPRRRKLPIWQFALSRRVRVGGIETYFQTNERNKQSNLFIFE